MNGIDEMIHVGKGRKMIEQEEMILYHGSKKGSEVHREL